MKCDCCGRRKKLFESYEKVASRVDLCVDCSTLHYKLRDYKNENNTEKCSEIMKAIKKKSAKKSTKEYEKWFESFK